MWFGIFWGPLLNCTWLSVVEPTCRIGSQVFEASAVHVFMMTQSPAKPKDSELLGLFRSLDLKGLASEIGAPSLVIKQPSKQVATLHCVGTLRWFCGERIRDPQPEAPESCGMLQTEGANLATPPKRARQPRHLTVGGYWLQALGSVAAWGESLQFRTAGFDPNAAGNLTVPPI